MADNVSFMEEVRQLQSAIEKYRTVEAPSKADICAYYKTLKPILTAILPFLEKIPVWGKQVADAIQLLMKSLDGFCA